LLAYLHGRPQKFFQGEQPRHFAYLVHVVDDAVQMHVHKTLCAFYTKTKLPRVTATVAKIALSWRSNASFSFTLLLFTQYKTTKLTAISSHYLAAFSAKNVCVQQSHMWQNAYYRNLK